MTPLWVARLDADPGGCTTAAELRDATARPVGWLCLWQTGDRPHERAAEIDPRVHDPSGPPCVLSLALVPPRARPIADDPAVVHARRRVLASSRACAVTLLTADPVKISGSLTVARGDRPDQILHLRDDPFSRLWPAQILNVDAGLFGRLVRPTGPSLERYAGKPWPYDRF